MVIVDPDEPNTLAYRVGELERDMQMKADTAALVSMAQQMASFDSRLATTNKILLGVLLTIIAASIGFGFAALQIAGS